MTLRSLFLIAMVAGIGTGSDPILGSDPSPSTEEAKKAPDSRAEKLYKQGTKSLDDEDWDEAAAAFTEAARLGGPRADASLYWLAYSLAKQGRPADALAILRGFPGKYPKSSWLKEVRALEAEVRRTGGGKSNPEAEDDEELKIMAINSLIHSDPERAVPLLEKILKGRGSEEVKERALFVLAQSGSARGRQIIADVARGNAHPDLQEKAIHYLGVFGGRQNGQLLDEIYRGTTNNDVKEKILHAWMISGDRARVLDAARSEKSTELRGAAAHQLGVMGARAELWQLYKTERSRDVKEEIIQGLFIAGDVEHILQLARTETDRDLREEAIQKLGIMGARTAPALWEIYRSETDVGLREAVIQAFFVQGNARALIDIAKTEKNKELRNEALQKLSVMNNKEARDYLLQFLDD
ncbi:MAG: HEAT repeat domain-containing protein [Acidobacteriota bacterium]|nr:HEAT repeat domain-containing protein [Acidobacteriota bacterium]